MKKKIVQTIGLIILLSINTVRATDCRTDCSNNFSVNSDYLAAAYFDATISECMPLVGSQNQAGLSDLYNLLANGTILEGAGAIAQGLDLASDYWACLDRLQDDYYRGLDALGASYDTCVQNCDDEDDFESDFGF